MDKINTKLKIIFLGAPGSGKGTISHLLVEKYNFLHISTGELFRNELDLNGPLSSEINLYLKNGDLVPDSITNLLVKNKLNEVSKKEIGIILDGYPRNIIQAKFLEEYFIIDKVFYIGIEDDLVIKRISGRLTCPKCNKIYNKYFSPPKNNNRCDIDNSDLTQRKDDNIDVIKNRIQIYNEYTFPLIKFYNEKHCLLKINGNQNIKQIIELIDKELNC